MKIGDDWTKRPITLTLAGIQTGVEDLKPRQTEAKSLLPSARQLLALREELRTEEERLASGRLDLARRYLRSAVVRLPSPPNAVQPMSPVRLIAFLPS